MPHHRHAAPADIGRGHRAGLLLGRGFEDAGPAHVEALADGLGQSEVRLRAGEVRQKPDQRHVGAAGRRILGDADAAARTCGTGCRPRAPSPAHRDGCRPRARAAGRGRRRRPRGAADLSAARDFSSANTKRRAARRDAGPMPLDLDVGGLQRAGVGDDIGRNLLADAERHRGGQARGDDTPASRVSSMRTSPAFSSNTSRSPAIGAAVALPGAGQHEGRADIGMAGERHLGLGREDAHLGGVAGSRGGRTKVVSARLNSAAIDCICSVDRPCALVTTASGLPPNWRSVKTSTVMNSCFMRRTLAACQAGLARIN